MLKYCANEHGELSSAEPRGQPHVVSPYVSEAHTWPPAFRTCMPPSAALSRQQEEHSHVIRHLVTSRGTPGIAMEADRCSERWRSGGGRCFRLHSLLDTIVLSSSCKVTRDIAEPHDSWSTKWFTAAGSHAGAAARPTRAIEVNPTATAPMSQALDFFDPRTLLGQWFEDHRTGARYYVAEENGRFLYVFEDGTRLEWPSPQNNARSPRYVAPMRRLMFHRILRLTVCKICGRRVNGYNQQGHGAVPRSQLPALQNLTEAFWQLNVDPNQGNWNTNGYQDRSGAAPWSRNEPQHMIPGQQIRAHRTLRETAGAYERLDPSMPSQ
nr:hypothetical protein CFP56_13394 [Quercus suber]